MYPVYPRSASTKKARRQVKYANSCLPCPVSPAIVYSQISTPDPRQQQQQPQGPRIWLVREGCALHSLPLCVLVLVAASWQFSSVFAFFGQDWLKWADAMPWFKGDGGLKFPGLPSTRRNVKAYAPAWRWRSGRIRYSTVDECLSETKCGISGAISMSSQKKMKKRKDINHASPSSPYVDLKMCALNGS